MIWTFSNTYRYQPPWNCCAFVSSHLHTFLCVQCDFPDVMLKGSWSVRQKISNGANVHNNDSQKRFVLFWPHKWNKNIFINSGAIYQAKCNRSCDVTSEWMHYVLARWRPTSHSSAVRTSQLVYKLAYSRGILDMYDNYCLSVNFFSNGTAN